MQRAGARPIRPCKLNSRRSSSYFLQHHQNLVARRRRTIACKRLVAWQLGVPNAHRPKSQFALPTEHCKRPRLSRYNRFPGRSRAQAKSLTLPRPLAREKRWPPPVDATRRPPPWPLAREKRCLAREKRCRVRATRRPPPWPLAREKRCRSPPWRWAGLSQKQSVHSRFEI